MQAWTDPTTLRLGDAVVIETQVDQEPVVIRGKLSNLLPKVVWVNVADPGCPPVVSALEEGHPVRLSAPRDGRALVGDSTFRSCLGIARRLIALSRPTDLQLVDRRAALRVAMRRSVGVRLARNPGAGEGGHFAIGTSLDVGMAGMRFETTVHMAVGDHVFVTVVLDRNLPLYSLALIVRLEDAIADGRAGDSHTRETPGGDGQRPVWATVKWEAMCSADRERLQSFLINADRAALG